MEIEQKIKQLISEGHDIALSDIKNSSNLETDLKMNSLSTLIC